MALISVQDASMIDGVGLRQGNNERLVLRWVMLMHVTRQKSA